MGNRVRVFIYRLRCLFGAKDLAEIIVCLLSPTRIIASLIKKPDNPQVNAEIIKNFNFIYLFLSFLFVIILYSKATKLPKYALLFFLFFAVSRVNEVFFAFLYDASDKLNNKPAEIENGLRYYDRIFLALKSYIGLILDYAIIYYILTIDPFTQFLEDFFGCYKDPKFSEISILDAVYYSGVTITTTGFGDISFNCHLFRFLSVYEVLNGILLIVVCFTVYTALIFNQNDNSRDILPTTHNEKKLGKIIILNIHAIFMISLSILIT